MNKAYRDNYSSDMSRRDFLAGLAGAAAALAVSGAETEENPGTKTLPPLPYEENALEPHISSRTVHFHYQKHHRGYIDKLNAMISGTKHDGKPLGQIISETAGRTEETAIFNNAAQAWNHDFYWKSMSPDGGGDPPPPLKKMIEGAFGGMEAFKKEFISAALSQFGSGWAWLVKSGDSLKIVKTPNAETPFKAGVPLIVIDVWEHAYYLDYQNRRNDYAKVFLAELVNWRYAAENAG